MRTFEREFYCEMKVSLVHEDFKEKLGGGSVNKVLSCLLLEKKGKSKVEKSGKCKTGETCSFVTRMGLQFSVELELQTSHS